MPTPTKITRELVLTRAMEIVDREGADGLGMRELARSLGVKAASLYRYFPDRAGIELAVVEEGNRKLLECLKGAAGMASPGEEWDAVGEVYVAFARSKPHLYRLMVDGRVGFGAGPGRGGPGKELWEFLVGVAGGAAESGSGEVNSGDTGRAVALWSFLHGFVSLDGEGRFGKSGGGDGFAVGLKALRKGFLGEVSR